MSEPARHCLACDRPLRHPHGRQTYCNRACRQDAYRRRHQPPPLTPAALPPPGASRRTHTVYACPACETRYLGEQRCPDCNTFATRLGPGGPCSACETLLTIDELLAGT